MQGCVYKKTDSNTSLETMQSNSRMTLFYLLFSKYVILAS